MIPQPTRSSKAWVTGATTYFLLDGQGNIFQQWLGPVNREELAAAFELALRNNGCWAILDTLVIVR